LDTKQKRKRQNHVAIVAVAKLAALEVGAGVAVDVAVKELGRKMIPNMRKKVQLVPSQTRLGRVLFPRLLILNQRPKR